jgi:prolipoprotein diacylglyceryltransferase
MLAGIGRFGVEVLRVNPRVVLGLSEAQIISLALFTVGALSWLHARHGVAVATA